MIHDSLYCTLLSLPVRHYTLCITVLIYYTLINFGYFIIHCIIISFFHYWFIIRYYHLRVLIIGSLYISVTFSSSLFIHYILLSLSVLNDWFTIHYYHFRFFISDWLYITVNFVLHYWFTIHCNHFRLFTRLGSRSPAPSDAFLDYANRVVATPELQAALTLLPQLLDITCPILLYAKPGE